MEFSSDVQMRRIPDSRASPAELKSTCNRFPQRARSIRLRRLVEAIPSGPLTANSSSTYFGAHVGVIRDSDGLALLDLRLPLLGRCHMRGAKALGGNATPAQRRREPV
jgi:hypothetical protein